MGHVAYQIKANDTCSNMVANLTHSFDFDPTQGVKGKIFKFRNNFGRCQYFLLKFCMQAEEQYI